MISKKILARAAALALVTSPALALAASSADQAPPDTCACCAHGSEHAKAGASQSSAAAPEDEFVQRIWTSP